MFVTGKKKANGKKIGHFLENKAFLFFNIEIQFLYVFV